MTRGASCGLANDNASARNLGGIKIRTKALASSGGGKKIENTAHEASRISNFNLGVAVLNN
jgi:hypothetical protein